MGGRQRPLSANMIRNWESPYQLNNEIDREIPSATSIFITVLHWHALLASFGSGEQWNSEPI
jgi:hypothetical protein